LSIHPSICIFSDLVFHLALNMSQLGPQINLYAALKELKLAFDENLLSSMEYTNQKKKFIGFAVTTSTTFFREAFH